MWIRSQNKENLVQVDCLCIEKNEIDKGKYIYSDFDIVQGCIILGTYNTKERALEVLDEIQTKIAKLSYQEHFIGKDFIGIESKIYEMPKE